MPPYLAGRASAMDEILNYLQQQLVLTNVVLTGLRGVGKTVLLETVRPRAIATGWHWIGTDLSESASINEDSLTIRLLADLSVLTSTVQVNETVRIQPGFTGGEERLLRTLDFATLKAVFESAPGLVADKLKFVLELIWQYLPPERKGKGMIFAYDEAQNLADHAEKQQYPLSMLLDVFQSLQKKGMPYLLLLTGLPTLFPKLVEARTYAERMFHVVLLDRLSGDDTREAILKPLAAYASHHFDDATVARIAQTSGGYPYFVQFICREAFDFFLQQGEAVASAAPIEAIVYKLDSDFFAGRWAKVTDRQRDLLMTVASLPSADSEFSVQEVVARSKTEGGKPFSASHVNQMLATLVSAGLVYKNRHGRYAFAVPMLGDFIRRQALGGVC